MNVPLYGARQIGRSGCGQASHLKAARATGAFHSPILILFSLAHFQYAHAETPAENEDAGAFTATYAGEMIRNTRGGLRTGGTYLDNLDLTLELDGTRSGHLPGLRFFAYALYNNAQTFSERFSGDAQTASNIDAPRVLRLYEAWIDWTFGPRDTSLRFGLSDLNTEFDVSDGRALFINSSFGVGHELGQTGRNGPSIFPAPALGLRIAHRPGDESTILAAVFDGDPGDPQKQSLHVGGDDGALAIMEFQRSDERMRKLAIGGWHYTRRFDRVDDSRTGYSSGAYVFGESRLWSDAAVPARGIDAFARIGFATSAVNEYARSAQAGVVWSAPFSQDGEESLGLGAAWARVGMPFRRARRAEGEPLDSYETAFEVTYRRSVASWLTLQPDVQYIVNPGADPSLRNTLVLGLRFEVTAAKTW
jgi:porin